MTGAAWVQAAATIVLVAITSWYAWTTHKMLSSQDTRRRRERSERAAMSILEVIREPPFREAGGEVTHSAAADLRKVIDFHTPLVDHADLRERLIACSVAAMLLTYRSDQIEKEGTTQGQAILCLQKIATTTRWSLEAYVTEKDLPEWGDLPSAVETFAWIRRPIDGSW